MASLAARPSSSEPIGYALLLAAALHGLGILGISFVPQPSPPKPAHKSLRVVLVQPRAQPPKTVEKPDLLAQTNQTGGGARDTREAAAEAADAPVMHTPPPLAAEPKSSAPPPGHPPPVADTAPAPAAARDTPKLTRLQAPRSTPPPPRPPRARAKPPQTPTTAELPPSAPRKPVSAAQLFASRNLEIARLTSELERKSNAYSQRSRRKAISASTREYKYAAYLEAWRRKVERIGNLNYPDEARRNRLFGNLMLTVAVRSDGSVERIRLLHSSGHKVLDDAAIRIVRLAAPFAPFPADILKETDVLDITRTWQFLSSNRLGWK